MSYRSFKKLLGETSLERKCRFLLGGFILLLISGSFWLYARQTEDLAYDQTISLCRLLVQNVIDEKLATVCAQGNSPTQSTFVDELLAEYSHNWHQTWPKALRESRINIYRPGSKLPEKLPEDALSQERMREFLANPKMMEDNRLMLNRSINRYYGAIRASGQCITCHQKTQPGLTESGLIGMIRVELTVPIDDAMERRVHINRALLITTALVTALLIMTGSYLIIRYVIVKPLNHLKEVSDAISAGELNVRSEIQTGDEFEDLSHAFNRMLRSLVSMQDQLKKANQDLDFKVDELAQANLALYESNRLKGEFLATVSHELKTPLHSIRGFSDVLMEDGTLTEKQLRWVTNIRASGEKLMGLITDILDLAKIEAGKMGVRTEEFKPVDVCEGVLSMFRPIAERKALDLRGEIDALQGLKVRQDIGKIQQILSNLVSNAIKFTPQGGTVSLRGRSEKDLVIFEVEDTGVGIAEDEQELVFDKFRQTANPMTRDYSGTGLGLSIVRELTRILGGEVQLQSELGKGSIFIIRLPMILPGDSQYEITLVGDIDLTRAQRIDARLLASGSRDQPAN
ncbi:MAG: HAMP domain-containing sensor histidine kinase [Planctomycetota bacterium]|nr:HAMP domain-containing sensor histidine kinase [Planctomycetota bacterium]